jgi:hypothetical protein
VAALAGAKARRGSEEAAADQRRSLGRPGREVIWRKTKERCGEKTRLVGTGARTVLGCVCARLINGLPDGPVNHRACFRPLEQQPIGQLGQWRDKWLYM